MPAMMTAAVNDFGIDQMFARPLRGLGGKRRCAVRHHHLGAVVQRAACAAGGARDGDCHGRACWAGDGGPALPLCDFVLLVPDAETARIQECHITLGHAVLTLLEDRLVAWDGDLVTGAAGFIGYHVGAALLARGIEVVGVDDLNAYYDVRLKQARLARLAPRGSLSTAWTSRTGMWLATIGIEGSRWWCMSRRRPGYATRWSSLSRMRREFDGPSVDSGAGAASPTCASDLCQFVLGVRDGIGAALCGGCAGGSAVLALRRDETGG